MLTRMRSSSGGRPALPWWETLGVLALVTAACCEPLRLVLRPKPEHCRKRILHDRKIFGNKEHYYFFSWLHVSSRHLQVDWLDARNICRIHCMDAVSIETPEENDYITSKMVQYGVPYIWTSGRKCNFRGCRRADLFPLSINGWFWAGSGAKMGPTNDPTAGNWSPSGGIGLPQPDNRGFLFGDEDEEEACVAVMNNFYNDGVKWHDVGCYHEKPFVCEDNDELIDFVESNGGSVKGVTFDRDVLTAPVPIVGPVTFDGGNNTLSSDGSAPAHFHRRPPPFSFFV